MSKQTNTKPEELLLYAVTDRHWLNGATLISQVEAALKGGATFIQLREKNLDDEAFYKEALEIQKLCRNYKVPFVINDNVELAKKIGADGVHVGQSDMEALDVRKVLGDDKIIGVSAQMGVAGEVGYANMEPTDGNATYRNRIIDAIYNMDADKLCSMAKCEIR